MFQPLPLSIGLRYLRAKRRNGFISFISMASIIGIIIGVIALITTIAVMTGFQQELRERILGMVAHATVSGIDGPVPDWQRAVALAEQDPRVTGAAPYVEMEALLAGSLRRGAIVQGVMPDQEPKVSEISQKMTVGRLDELREGAFNIILGSELARHLGVAVGDSVNVFVSTATNTPVGAIPRAKRFHVVGTFSAGTPEYDLGLAVIHLGDAQRLARMGEGVTGVRLRLVEMWNAWEVARDLRDRMEGYYRVRSWETDHANFFRALKMEKTVMFILLSLVIAIAAFNLVSSLVMLVQDKQSDIAILRTLGLSPGGVMRIFVTQGVVIGVIGVVVGVVGGVLLASNLTTIVRFFEGLTGTEVMPSDVYYISGGVPSIVVFEDVVMVVLVSFTLCFLATLYPAWRASRTDPATALRYE